MFTLKNLFKNLEMEGDPFAKASAFPMDYKNWLASQGNFNLLASGNVGQLKDLPNPGDLWQS